MSEVIIKYASLEDVMNFALKANTKIDNYVSGISSAINNPIGNLPGNDSSGYAGSAANLASGKMALLTEKKEYFNKLKSSTENIITVAKTADANVATNISTIAESYIEERKWYEAVGDWIYNTFCVDIANHFTLVRNMVDCIKWVGDKAGNFFDGIKDWFKYGDGKYWWKGISAVVGAVVAIAGAVAAVCAIPFTGGATLPIVIGCIGAIATSISAVITVFNSYYDVRSAWKAGKLASEDKEGAARYYNSAEGMSGFFEKRDYGGQEENDKRKTAGTHMDNTKVVADTVAFVSNIASLGNIKDLRSGKVQGNKTGKGGFKGYDLSWENIKKNVKYDMGMYAKNSKKSGFKEGAFKIDLVENAKQKKYTLNIPDKIKVFSKTITFEKTSFSCPKALVKVFNVTKTTDNTMDFAKNIGGIYDFYTDSDKTFFDFADLVEDGTGIMGTTKALSIFEKYGTKTGKTLGNAYNTLLQYAGGAG